MIELNFYKYILIIFLIILYYGLKIESKNKYFNPFDSQQIKNFKGFCSIEILLHHLGYLVHLFLNSRYYIQIYIISDILWLKLFFSGF